MTKKPEWAKGIFFYMGLKLLRNMNHDVPPNQYSWTAV